MIEYLRRSDAWDDPDTPTEEALADLVCKTDEGACAIWDTVGGVDTHVVSTVYSDLQQER